MAGVEYDSKRILPPISETGLSVTPYIRDGLAPFWNMWGTSFRQVSIRLPDPSDPDWTKHFLPPDFVDKDGVDRSGEIIRSELQLVPYYRFDGTRDESSMALTELMATVEAAGYFVIVDIEPALSLSPLVTAGKSDRTIVIGLGASNAPRDKYPSIDRPDRLEWYRPFTLPAREINEGSYAHSAAFFFQLDPNLQSVRNVLHEKAYRVQIIADNPIGEGLIWQLINISDMVSPGGEIMVTGDGRLLNAANIERYFGDKLGWSVYGDRLKEIFEQYNSVRYYNLDGGQLLRIWGLDSMWIVPDPSFLDPDRFILDDPYHPGVAIFTGKKP